MELSLETEWLEFKEAKGQFDFETLGRYFSALSNEANLKGIRCGWLIFGVTDKPPRQIVGTAYKNTQASLDKLKAQIAQYTTSQISFTEIYELKLSEGRVLMFQIPAAPRGLPVEWKGCLYGRVGENIGPLNQQEIDYIRNQPRRRDWSAEYCPGATVNDLDPAAMVRARQEFKIKNSRLGAETDNWDDLLFLSKMRLAVDGRITRAAIILLGRDEAQHFISPGQAWITWILKDEHGIEKDYQHFGPPFLLNSDSVFAMIRNLTYRYLPGNTLFPNEIPQYEEYVLRETLHNCIAHQDYELAGRINVVESPDQLLFTNVGTFLPGSVEEVITRDAPPESYRNPLLVQAMVQLNMIDAYGSGIKRMFIKQRERNFPMPDYDLSEAERVKVRIWGRIIDENYTRMLLNNMDLELPTVICLDKVQKGKGRELKPEEVKELRTRKLIEGRKPNFYVSAKIAAITDNRSGYIKNRAFDDEYYKDLIISYLEKYKSASRKDLSDLLHDKLSDALGPEQKENKIRNLIFAMSGKDKTIVNRGTNRKPIWVLNKK
ncbi:MAG: transcriptional regulator [Syntrophomonadaceae bacterium]|jgi:ATP-dependent DNA helicase RecG|nr:transcriptional regulator [Syntrophomonadaceae bacterium]